MATESTANPGGRSPADQQPPPLAALTTLRVGGPPRALIAVDSDAQVLQACADFDDDGTAYWPLGGGSNLVVADAGIDATVMWLRNSGTQVSRDDSAVSVRVGAGKSWDDLVAESISHGWSGLEALSGIPGTVGATPIQNVGAYGAQVADVITEVEVWDRQRRQARTMSAAQCAFNYRDSMFKRERMADGSPAFVVLAVTFTLPITPLSAPLRYPELAKAVDVEVGSRVDCATVRAAVLALRTAKGMVLDDNDHDTWSVGSFFTNPVVSASIADALPPQAPRWPVSADAADDAQPRVKLSAAWLVENAGFAKGYSLPGSAAAISSKHALAITNRGQVTAEEIVDLARTVREGVRHRFGVVLEVEPTLLGTSL